MSRGVSTLADAGLVIVDKPAGMTSHDVVAVLRRAFHTRRVGHAGTLDPDATGVLVLGIERGTKLLPLLITDSKTYDATFVIGTATVTEDAAGEITQTDTVEHLDTITPDAIMQAKRGFIGDIMQVPSAVSAIKVNGVRSYKRVRKGEDVVLAPRPIHIDSCHVSRIEQNPDTHQWEVDITVSCSSGTYIRALCRDIGTALGSFAHLTRLRRTRVGDFTLADARPLDYFQDASAQGEKPSLSLTLDEATVKGREIRHLTAEESHKVALGQRITRAHIDGIYAAVSPDGHTIALLEEQNHAVKSVFVARPATLS